MQGGPCFTRISTGYAKTRGITTARTVYCWGVGSLADSTSAVSSVAVTVMPP
ncbi:MAG: hypothetical protein KA154_09525 [Gemmatimonadaceae bacterium]|nr:hypothetical protein [Gemmatimonadaceae bacterium]